MRAARADTERIAFMANSHRVLKQRQATLVTTTFSYLLNPCADVTLGTIALNETLVIPSSILAFKPGQNLEHSVPLLAR